MVGMLLPCPIWSVQVGVVYNAFHTLYHMQIRTKPCGKRDVRNAQGTTINKTANQCEAKVSAYYKLACRSLGVAERAVSKVVTAIPAHNIQSKG